MVRWEVTDNRHPDTERAAERTLLYRLGNFTHRVTHLDYPQLGNITQPDNVSHYP